MGCSLCESFVFLLHAAFHHFNPNPSEFELAIDVYLSASGNIATGARVELSRFS